jgi:hypothetical protein
VEKKEDWQTGCNSILWRPELYMWTPLAPISRQVLQDWKSISSERWYSYRVQRRGAPRSSSQQLHQSRARDAKTATTNLQNQRDDLIIQHSAIYHILNIYSTASEALPSAPYCYSVPKPNLLEFLAILTSVYLTRVPCVRMCQHQRHIPNFDCDLKPKD